MKRRLKEEGANELLTDCQQLKTQERPLKMNPAASRTRNQEYYTVNIHTDSGKLVAEFNKLDKSQRDRVMGYVEAFAAMRSEDA